MSVKVFSILMVVSKHLATLIVIKICKLLGFVAAQNSLPTSKNINRILCKRLIFFFYTLVQHRRPREKLFIYLWGR